uniref:NADH-ubiquinone oxidoreductase chain 2 n=2 Tax=Anolis hyacinthogularis TaxID=2268058 RepID=A0A2Z4LH43_9SAUR|nr:NADH dehydrogenase subunit II [Anolis hyacinthogularis]
MSPTTYTILLSSLATGTIITMSSHHWLLAWVGLEINTLAIIPNISLKHHPRATEAATKYFLTQAMASAMILFSSMTNAWMTGTWDITQMSSTPSHILLTIALAMKLGLVPMHFWLPEVLQGTSLTTALIIVTWQKLAPMSLIFMTINNLSPLIFLTLGLLSSMLSGWAGLNQTQLRKIMAYSSIAHLGWMMTVASIKTNTMILALLIYMLLTMTVFYSLILSKSKTIQDTTTSWTLSPMLTIITMMALLSLGGLPPLTGFMPKWLILKELTTQGLLFMAIMMALTSLLSLFFYLRLTYTTAITFSPNTAQSKFKWRFKPPIFTLLIITIAPTMMLLPMLPLTTT